MHIQELLWLVVNGSGKFAKDAKGGAPPAAPKAATNTTANRAKKSKMNENAGGGIKKPAKSRRTVDDAAAWLKRMELSAIDSDP